MDGRSLMFGWLILEPEWLLARQLDVASGVALPRWSFSKSSSITGVIQGVMRGLYSDHAMLAEALHTCVQWMRG